MVWRASVQHRRTCADAMLLLLAALCWVALAPFALGYFFSPVLCWQPEDLILILLEPVRRVARVDFILKGFLVIGCVLFLTWGTLVLVIQLLQKSRLPAIARHWTLFTQIHTNKCALIEKHNYI